jgi:hypothetical protein
MQKDEISSIVREVLQEKGLLSPSAPKPVLNQSKRERSAPVVLNVFHSGVRKLEQALEQVRLIETLAAKSSTFTVNSARVWVCGGDVREKAGSRCILDTVKPEGIEKVLQKADILVLPTFCFKTAAKAAHLIGDDQESAIVLSALVQGKATLAANDGFTLLNTLSNTRIKDEIQQTLERLESFGMVFCQTEQLAATFKKLILGGAMAAPSENRKEPGNPAAQELSLITAREVRMAADTHRNTITLAPGGIITPLARDQAKEYNIRILRNHS